MLNTSSHDSLVRLAGGGVSGGHYYRKVQSIAKQNNEFQSVYALC